MKVFVTLSLFIICALSTAYAQTNVPVGGNGGKCPTVAYQYAGGIPHLLICMETADNTHRGAYTSTNGGNTWACADSTLNGGENCNCVMDSNGNVCFAGINNTIIWRSSNYGASWDSNCTPFFTCPSNGVDYPYLAMDLSHTASYGNVYMAWASSFYDTTCTNIYSGHCTSDSGTGLKNNDSAGVLFSRSLDHGATWSTPIVISNLPPDSSSIRGKNPYTPQMCVDGNGVIYALYTANSPTSTRIVYVYTSTNQGVTWVENGSEGAGLGNTNNITTDGPFHTPISIAASPVDGTVRG